MVACGSTCGAGAALGSDVVGAAAGWVSAGVGVAGAFSTGGGVAAAGVAAAGGFCGSDATGATGAGAAAFDSGAAGAAPGSGVVAVAAGVGAWAGMVVVMGWLGCTSTAPEGMTTTGGAWVCCLSNSAIFWSKAARRAACTGVSAARTEMKLAQITATQTAGNNLGICMTLFYAYFPPDATAFPVVENNFCHAPGMG